MSLSPMKKATVLNRMGKMFSRRYKTDFLEADFKKKDGFKKSVELSKNQKLYRQNYCGCIYSQKKLNDNKKL
jgi:predicted adenine nucleotide alpha hydrolase (AANH) superfamily ATPase